MSKHQNPKKQSGILGTDKEIDVPDRFKEFKLRIKQDKIRFILIEQHPEFQADDETVWYWDTNRPLENAGTAYVAVQCYRDKDPNKDVVYHETMRLLFTDQAEYYAVCEGCSSLYNHYQWSGSTSSPNWRSKSATYLKKHQETKGWCEFCDPVFGNGGWILR